MNKHPYEAFTKNGEHRQPNGELWWGVSGPNINGELGYYSHTMNPELSMETQEEAERAAKIANIAYAVEYRQAQWDIQKALGITK
jgi:hypothetical protein